ncbi:LiaI-LiaF-like domain-containing protein [Methyloversatilis sp.]|uniref:LiaI-LiaF-like domain-containing protein n=1 Tax=Methyloversatilis sp. TaxID=2569862 RepID=UPI0035B26D0E
MIGSIGLIIVGALLLASNLDLFSLRELADLLGTWWPALLIAAGIAGLVKRK